MRRTPVLLAIVLGAALVTTTAPVGAAPPPLGPVVRVRTPGDGPCPTEGEPDVVVTRAGTWVAYHDWNGCYVPSLSPHATVREYPALTTLQLLPAGGGPPRVLRIPGRAPDEFLMGDPSLAPDPHGDGVLLASRYDATQGETVEVYRVSTSMRHTLLPTAMIGSVTNAHRGSVATDTSPRSRYRGRAYLVWDRSESYETVLRAFDGRRWTPHVVVQVGYGRSDVAVAPNGDVAVAYETNDGVAVRTSTDGGKTFGPPRLVVRGYLPGRPLAGCVGPTVGVRQRVDRSVRATYDDAGTLHVVAALGHVRMVYDTTSTGWATSPLDVSRVVHASSVDGRTWRSAPLGESRAVRFHPTVAPAPGGGVAVAWAEEGADGRTFDVYVATARRGSAAFSAPVRVSPAPSPFPTAHAAYLNAQCYGIGEHISLARSPRGVVAAWASADATMPPTDSDVLLREVHLR